ncbi:MAG: M20/M25/M40 family metallo-hydrolase [Sphingomonadales bacterium]|jgi:acetylornithine deacetylase/succinyl-diaminopimelate desuccinylase-like protein|nr:M20/M25/M40 family metallo-hydrolase [Sphingomonadales bacterium]MBK6720417.1 M20/M25/M40 family metallo-hydrolase [Sphingomonadales bacterium]MBK8272787.1 M20/M25/M40 family metallo-hydrolase [Sphingomonadales bacterium]MBK8861816.1 M20/M25/M40 family metallo-hydrolase [Sphingomonadales bacterium]
MRLSHLLLCAALIPAPALAATDWHAEGRAILEKAISVPTVQERADPRLGDLTSYLKGKFEAAGITDIMIKPYLNTQAMIVRWPAAGKAKKKPILLLGHMDVVEAKREDWPQSHDPFKLVEEDGYLYGRGTTDMKNGITAITVALLRLKAEGFKPKRDIIVLFTGDEENGGRGAELAATEWRKLTDAEYALNADAGGGAFLKDGTPLGFGLQTSEKMYQSFTFTVRNPGGHSSRPRPDNAIYELSSALKKLETHRFTPALNETTRAYFTARATQEKGALGDAMRRWLKNENDSEAADFIEADPTEVGGTRTRCVATRLQGGHADNALPQMAQATVNCRILPGIPAKDVQAELQAAVGAGVEVAPTLSSHPSPASPLRPDVVKAYTDSIRARHPGSLIIPQMSAGATDGLYFRATGMPVYGVDGTWIVVPDDERAHGRDERIPVKSFNQNLDHWHDLLAKLAG